MRTGPDYPRFSGEEQNWAQPGMPPLRVQVFHAVPSGPVIIFYINGYRHWGIPNGGGWQSDETMVAVRRMRTDPSLPWERDANYFALRRR